LGAFFEGTTIESTAGVISRGGSAAACFLRAQLIVRGTEPVGKKDELVGKESTSSGKHLAAVVLAAGLGTRMDGDRQKALVPLGGKPMLLRVLEAVRGAGIDHICVVVGHEADKVIEALPDGCRWVEQPVQGGTAHALSCCEAQLGNLSATLVVLYCDNPFITGSQIKSLVRKHLGAGAAATVLTVALSDPGRFGRIVRDDKGNVVAIVEASQATEQQLEIKEVNTGVYCFESPLIFSVLPRIAPKGAKGERYLTDAVELLISNSHKVVAAKTRITSAAIGVNTREELEAAERELARQRRRMGRGPAAAKGESPGES